MINITTFVTRGLAHTSQEQAQALGLNLLTLVPIAIPAIWAAFIYSKRRRSERAQWLFNITRDVYFSDRFDDVQQVLEHDYEGRIDILLESRINDRQVEMNPADIKFLNSLDNFLNYIEHLLGLEARGQITTSERRSIFNYWPNVIGRADRFSALRMYVAICGYTAISEELKLEADEHLVLYGSALPQLRPAAQPDVNHLLEEVGEAAIRGRLYEVIGGSYRYPGIELLVPEDSRILHPDKRSSSDARGRDSESGPAIVYGILYRVLDPGIYRILDEWEGFRAVDPSGSPYIRRLVRLEEPRIDSWIYAGNHSPAERRLLEGISRWHEAI